MHDPWPRIIAHADMDAFYASVEQRDDPALRGRPVLVGPPGGRGVVLTASYEARPYGVGSAMPMAEALRRCPQAIVVPPGFERYQAVSRSVMAVFAEFSPAVDAISLDEAFLDMSGASHIFGPPEQMATRLKAAVHEATGGLHVSVGVSGTKYVAKVASAVCKPNGLAVIAPDRAQAWLAGHPVKRLWGAGPVQQTRLHEAGYHTIGDVARASRSELVQTLGSIGAHFHDLALAQDPRPVTGRGHAASLSSDRTLTTDVAGEAAILPHLMRAADRVATRLRRRSYVAGGVRVKLKTSGFQLLTRQRRLPRPTDVAGQLYRAAASLLPCFDHPGPFRLIGLAAYELSRDPARGQDDLFDDPTTRRLETAIDALTERFGSGAVRRARDLNRTVVNPSAPNLDFLDDDSPS